MKMAQPILVLGLQRAKWESLSQGFLDKEGKPTEAFRAHQVAVQSAFVESGGKRIVLASDEWGFSGWHQFLVNEFPSFESFQTLNQRLRELQYQRYFDFSYVPGIDRLKAFEDLEHIRKVRK
jgi:hypothetical protein